MSIQSDVGRLINDFQSRVDGAFKLVLRHVKVSSCSGERRLGDAQNDTKSSALSEKVSSEGGHPLDHLLPADSRRNFRCRFLCQFTSKPIADTFDFGLQVAPATNP